MPAIACDELIAEVEGAVQGGSLARRGRMLQQITGLFLSQAGRLNDQQISIFDEIFVRLVEQSEPRTLAHLSMVLADVPAAPREATRRLACHEDERVAAPVLRNSNTLSELDLAGVASDAGLQHILAIANRTKLSPALTDLLLARADTSVCRALAGNQGARFSDLGYATLTARAERDDDIADSLALRSDTPLTVFRTLLPKVTKAVRTRLLNLAPPETCGAIQEAIDGIEIEESTKPPVAVDYSEAKSIVLALNNGGKLNDSTVNRFAVRQEHTNLVAALSLLATVDIEIIEPLIEQSDGCGLLIACRASRLNWHTALAVVSHRKNARKFSPQDVERRRESFEALPLSIAQWTIRFGSIEDFAGKFSSTENASTGEGAVT